MRQLNAMLTTLILIVISTPMFAADLEVNSGWQGNIDIRRTKVSSPEPPSNYYINQNFLACGKTDVLVLTVCVDYEEEMPFCINQHIDIFDKKTGNTSSVSYDFAFDSGNQQFISNIDCKNVDGSNYLILQNTNFGNCIGCEWVDVYSANGKYMGSTQGIYDTRHPTHFSIPKTLDASLSSPKVVTLARINIFRTRPKESRLRTH